METQLLILSVLAGVQMLALLLLVWLLFRRRRGVLRRLDFMEVCNRDLDEAVTSQNDRIQDLGWELEALELKPKKSKKAKKSKK